MLNSQTITGFNKWAFLVGLAGFHTGKIFTTKTLFHEMGKGALNHVGMAVGVGICTGLFIGQLFSYDMTLYKKWRQTKRLVDRYERQLNTKH